MAGIYNGHLLEFPLIRVDCFTSPPSPPWLLPSPLPLSSSTETLLSTPAPPTYHPAPPALLHLLTHVHTDHLLGLSSSFTGLIVCHPDTKRMLLRLEAENERGLVAEGSREGRGRRKYDGLKGKWGVDEKGKRRWVDRIEALPYNHPKVFDLGYDNGKSLNITVTLLDANHCPGSAMFLITSPIRSVLHTGDVRADDLFLKTLRRNPAVSPFIMPWHSNVQHPARADGVRRQLDRVYIDTSAMLGTGDMPDKELVLRNLVERMKMFPDDTIFFLNVWCFGWEDVVKEVARHFNALHSIYNAVQTDPFLAGCTTLDHGFTRFHACERTHKCEGCRVFDKEDNKVYNLNKRIVQVNMVEVKTAAWEVEQRAFLDKLGDAAMGSGQWPCSIDCPIARHSPLPELQALVKLFRPRSLSPNAMIPQADALGYYLLPDLFRDSVDDEACYTMISERDEWFRKTPKFGQAYLDAKKGLRIADLQSTGQELVLDHREHWDQMIRGEVGFGEMGKIGRGRKDHAMEQIARAGGLAFLPSHGISGGLVNGKRSGELTMDEAMPSLPPAVRGQIKDMMGQKVPTMTTMAMPTLSAGCGTKRDEDDLDTDEENEEEKRKRRKRTGAIPNVGRAERSLDPPRKPDGKLAKCVEKEESAKVEDAGQLADQAGVADRSTSHKVSISRYRSSLSDQSARSVPYLNTSSLVVKKERLAGVSSTHRSTRAGFKFKVDKEHLRALATVAADPSVGDLY